MKNYNATSIPSMFSNLNRGRTMDYYGTNFRIPAPKLGVDYYGNIKDSPYNTFRVDAVALVDCGCNMQSVMYVHTPDGIEHLICNNSSGAEHYLNYFEDKEDFMNYAMNGNSKNNMPNITLKEFLKDSSDLYTFDYSGYQGNVFTPMGFVWRNGKVEKVPAFFDLVWKDKKGLHVTFANNFYTSKEECFKANFLIVGGEFPEDRPKVKSFKVSIEIEVLAENETDAQRIAKEKIAYIIE